MNLANLGLTGLAAAQSRLQTTGHNINNAATDGYNRQQVAVETAGAQATGAGYIGRGVRAVTVQRAYDNFLFKQLSSSEGTLASFTTFQTEITQINNLFADRTVGVSPALQKFFDGVNAVASAPADSAARQEMLGRASSLVSQINDSNAFLNQQRENINTQITTVVTQVNSMVERVRDLNTQIVNARASVSSHEPNDLLDQRDQLVRELNQLVGVNVIEQEGKVNLTVGNGQILLGGDSTYPLVAKPSDADPSRVTVATTLPGTGGTTVVRELDESRMKGGTLGGLLAYRRDALDTVQNDLGRLATGLAIAFNKVHATGEDLAGNAGGEFFALGDIKTIPNNGNQGSGSLEIGRDNINKLTGSDYQLAYDGTNYTLTEVPGGRSWDMTLNGTSLEPVPDATDSAIEGTALNGLTFTLSGTPQAGDSWLVQPTRSAAASLSLTISEPEKIAVAKPGTGTANGDIGLDLAKLQTDKVLGNGSMSLNEAFSQIVNRVGVLTQQNNTSVSAQKTLVQQNFSAQQGFSGVNLNEEYVNLERYQEQFRASSRLIDVSSTLFDTLLALRN
jgi:flagellar hook-associated protein 1 FlgK